MAQAKKTCKELDLLIGGMAVIDGVMMRSPNFVCTAIRKPSKKIAMNCERVKKYRFPFLYWPFVRGVTSLFQMLVLGMKALSWSAQEAGAEDEKLSTFELVMTITISMALAVGMFVVVPFVLAWIFKFEGFLFNLMDGIFRVAVFVLYLFFISFFEDIRDLFAYHGAEHRSVHAYEHGKKLSVAAVKKYPNAHPRCGSSFIIFVLVISIVVFSLLVTDSMWIKLAGRLVLLPLIAGISYELLRWSAKIKNEKAMRAITWPGILIQGLTTRDPRDDQIEVAVTALEKCIAKERSLALVRGSTDA